MQYNFRTFRVGPYNLLAWDSPWLAIWVPNTATDSCDAGHGWLKPQANQGNSFHLLALGCMFVSSSFPTVREWLGTRNQLMCQSWMHISPPLKGELSWLLKREDHENVYEPSLHYTAEPGATCIHLPSCSSYQCLQSLLTLYRRNKPVRTWYV